MAVVQISKIQVRRGRKNSSSGVPQLSSAEFAWTVDSQELYIGNGSVAEGAPYVGNTKIITEHDNILDLANGYQFASNDTSITLSVPRSLQSKLDETVSVLDFGAVGDASTDNVAAFETAFDELFKNVNTDYKKVLLIPNGEYVFLTDLKIPSNVIMRGETQDGVVLNFSDNNIRFTTAEGLEFVDFNSSNRPVNIQLSNFTVSRTIGQTVLSGVADSTIESVTFRGDYVLGDSVSDLFTQPAAVFWLNNLDGTKSTNNKFYKCKFESNAVSVRCSQTDAFESAVNFDKCTFFVNHVGIFIDGVIRQVNKWQVNDCHFEEIAAQAFNSTNGRSTLIQRTRFKNVGNGTGSAASPLVPMVTFGEHIGNIVVGCSSDRQQAAGVVTTSSTPAVTEVLNSDRVSFTDRNYSVIYGSDPLTPVAIFSALNKFFTINYSLIIGTHSRNGQLTLSINDDASNIAITDHYQYSPSLTTDNGGALMTNFEFAAENTGDAGTDTVVLYYRNPLIAGTGTPGSITFDVTYGV